MSPKKPIRKYEDFAKDKSFRNIIRDYAVFILSLRRSIKNSNNWIRFPYYHHVFDDERVGFSRHIDYMKKFGDFISLSEASNMLSSGEPISGRFFCISFDDGFKNCIENAVPILIDKGASATFFLPTAFIDTSLETDIEKLLSFFTSRKLLLEFLTWNDCKQMIKAGMGIGSHTVNHIQLSSLNSEEAQSEMNLSKQIIENKLECPCEFFCPPFGIPGKDFYVKRDLSLAKKIGYRSVLVGARGAMTQGELPHMIFRDHFLANWSTAQLRYFLSL